MHRSGLIALFLAGTATPAFAQSGGGSPDDRVIVVIGNRAIIVALQDLPVERTYAGDDVSAYGVGTVGEVVDQVAQDNGDESPALLVNGQPVASADDINDYPAEAIERIELLPRGAADRIGGQGGQRAYNIVLKKSISSATSTGGHRLATEGGWNEDRAELLLTHIHGQDRINLGLRANDSSRLLEAERGIVQPSPFYPWSADGNVIPSPLGASEIDPALSALARTPVAVAAVPEGVIHPSLADFAASANSPASIDFGRYRSLRPASRGYEATLAGLVTIAPSLSLSGNGRLGWNHDDGLTGLPTGLFVVTADNAASPFSRDVALALADPTRPLHSRSRTRSASGSLTLNATLGMWSARLGVSTSSQVLRYAFETSMPGAPATIAPARNPFTGTLGEQIAVVSEEFRTHVARSDVQADFDGPLLALPAGSLRLHGQAAVGRSRVSGSAIASGRSDSSQQLGVTIPIASRMHNVLGELGELSASVDVGRVHLRDYGTLWRESASLNWQLAPWLRADGGISREHRAPDLTVLESPVVSYPNFRIFDPLREESADVTYVTGGNPGLHPATLDTKRLAIGAAPWPKINLQLQAEYTATRNRNQLGALPAVSTAVLAAFPERFVRDANGRLVLFDARPVNFAAERVQQLRYSASFGIPLWRDRAAVDPAGPPVPPPAGRPRPRLDVTLAHSILLADTVVIRDGLPTIDLTREGESGIGMARPRHVLDGSLSLTDRGSGVRFGASYRSATHLLAGTSVDPERLRFGGLATFDLRAFAGLDRFFPHTGWAKGGRVTLVVQNLADRRQRVTDAAGQTPLAYQPAYREALGRTVMIELRKVF